jgi:soluble lytic murein transglycosylase
LKYPLFRLLGIFGIFFCFHFSSCSTGLGDMADGGFSFMVADADFNTLLQLDIALVERVARKNPYAAFYAAYLVEQKISSHRLTAEDTARAHEIVVKLYKHALKDEVVRDEAANRLRPIVLNSRKYAMEVVGISPATPPLRTLKAASLLTLGYYDNMLALYRDKAVSGTTEADWDQALLLLARLIQNSDGPENDLREDALAFFLADGIDRTRHWLWEEITRRELAPFLEAEENAVLGRLYTAGNAYLNALGMFRASYTLDKQLFTRYRGLLNDLGRAYFSGGGDLQEEGAALFLDWEAEAALDNQAFLDFRYLCLYYAGRIRRVTNKQDLAAEHFSRAVELAPDSLQKDACIWYLIEMEMGKKMETGVALIEKWADIWHDGDYFSDLYDRIAQWAAANNNWKLFFQLFPAIERGSSGLTRAKYAYIIGRALENGLISSIPAQNGTPDRTPEAFFTIAYTENTAPYYVHEPLLYYRTLAGLKLGKEPDFIEPPQQTEPYPIFSKNGRFLEGFFAYGAAKYAPAWIREYINMVPLEELRVLAGRLGAEKLWGEAIRLCTLYMKRPDFTLTADDLALYFPLGYEEMVTRFAEDYTIDRGILFGLIRTESIFIPDIISWAGAGGLTQLMPQTALETAEAIARQGGPDYITDDTVDRANPETNIHIGAYFLSHLMDTQATPLNALLSYNGGPTRVRRWARASNLPADLFMETVELKETREYGKKVLACAVLYNSFYFSLKSDRLIADIFGN